jgi:hypothetical protein
MALALAGGHTRAPRRVSCPLGDEETHPLIALAEQIAEAQRELALRKKCYPQWINTGKLEAGDAKYQIRVMEEIVRTLMRLAAAQRQLWLCRARAD